jgi:hypothetical protein
MKEPALVQNNEIGKCLLGSICEFSYDVVASKAVFRDHSCVEILALTLIQNMKRSPDTELTPAEDKLETDLAYIVQKEIL